MKSTWRELLLGRAKDPLNPQVFHTLSLAAFFAWVGLGADGSSSSCYGPEEAFLALREHRYLALPLALFMALTVFVISSSYTILIELFSSGGGGYAVTTKLLGKGAGLVCGCALVLDYMLTIAVSIAGGVEAIFSFLPPEWASWRPAASIATLVLLLLLNLRGVKESIVVLLPVFIVFLITHLIAIIGSLIGHADALPQILVQTPTRMSDGAAAMGGWAALLAVFFYAYSIGGGTYTGIEAVSNSMQILREPRVATGKRTMVYMAISLAVTAAGLLVGYLLWEVEPQPSRTLNAVLFDRVFADFRPAGLPLGSALVVVTLLSEGALLFVAAQAGFIGGPRTLATMALDRWVPNRFSHLSSRLVIQDGLIFMGIGAMAFLLFTGASVKVLVILYSINVFLTFTLSQLGLCVHWVRVRNTVRGWRQKLTINTIGLTLTSVVLVMMVALKFNKGGWITLVITALAVLVCVLINRHYIQIRKSIKELDFMLNVPTGPAPAVPPVRDAFGPSAALLVGGWNGLGMHSFLTVLRLFPKHFKNFIFVSVGVIDFEEFKGTEEIENLDRRTREALDKYVTTARSMGFYAEPRYLIATDLVQAVESIAAQAVEDFPGMIFFGGSLVFESENPLTRSLHSQAAFEIQRRLRLAGLPMMLLPIRVKPFRHG